MKSATLDLLANLISDNAIKKVYSENCSQRIPTDGFAEQNGRDAERAD
jgi:hypothetical protein